MTVFCKFYEPWITIGAAVVIKNMECAISIDSVFYRHISKVIIFNIVDVIFFLIFNFS